MTRFLAMFVQWRHRLQRRREAPNVHANNHAHARNMRIPLIKTSLHTLSSAGVATAKRVATAAARGSGGGNEKRNATCTRRRRLRGEPTAARNAATKARGAANGAALYVFFVSMFRWKM